MVKSTESPREWWWTEDFIYLEDWNKLDVKDRIAWFNWLKEEDEFVKQVKEAGFKAAQLEAEEFFEYGTV